MPKDFLGFIPADGPQWLDLSAWRAVHDWDKNGGLSDMQLDFNTDKLELIISGQIDLPTLPQFNRIDTDMLGKETSEKHAPGPLVDPAAQRVRNVDPRKSAR